MRSIDSDIRVAPAVLCAKRQTRGNHLKDSTMYDPAFSSQGEPMEWGPAHLRDDARTVEFEFAERPDDN